MEKSKFFLFFFLCALILFSCKKSEFKKNTPQSTFLEDEENFIPNEIEESTLLRNLTSSEVYFARKNKIVVIFGYNFNDDLWLSNEFSDLEKKFSLFSPDFDSFVFPLVYPKDFLVNGKTRNSKLLNLIDEMEAETDCQTGGILVLGAPEGFHSVLAKLQDRKSFPIFSFFPQDDILGSEATADFVLDYEQNSEILANEEFSENENSSEEMQSVSQIIERAILAQLKLLGRNAPQKNLLEFVQKIAGENRAVKNFTDGETALLSKNHFTMKKLSQKNE